MLIDVVTKIHENGADDKDLGFRIRLVSRLYSPADKLWIMLMMNINFEYYYLMPKSKTRRNMDGF